MEENLTKGGSVKVTLYQGNCLEEMKKIPDKSVDLVLCDLPYGSTACKWDCCIDLKQLWKEYKRILKDKGVIALFGDGGLFTANMMSTFNKTWFKYNWVWQKTNVTGFLNAKKQPLRDYETISIFSHPGQNNYYPIMVKGESRTYNNTSESNLYGSQNRTHARKTNSVSKFGKTGIYGNGKDNGSATTTSDEYYPRTVISGKEYSIPSQGRKHPSEKPVALLEYFIKTYTTEGMTVLDNTMGSGSTGVACVNTNRDFIGIELDQNYFNIAKTRIEEANNGTK